MELRRRAVYLTSPLLPQRHRILIDTGAQFSAISLDLVRRHNLQVDRVPAGEPQSLALAARNRSVRRMGTTTLPITVHFAGDLRRQPYECTKSFEVIDMLYDFILGVDIIPAIFEGDAICNYLISPSVISSPPSAPTAATFSLAYGQHLGEADMGEGTVINSYIRELLDEKYSDLLCASLLLLLATEEEDGEERIHVSVECGAGTRSVSALSACSDDGGDQIRVELHCSSLTRSVSTSAPAASAAVSAVREEREEEQPSLSQQIDEMGVGGVPATELPAKPTASTSADVEEEYALLRRWVLEELAPLLRINAALVGFCTGAGSLVRLTVRAEDEHHIFTRQYPLPQALEKAVDDCLQRWLEQGRIRLAPSGCKFNSPLLAVRKKDEQGRMTGVRVCIDIRKLNAYLVEDDRFQIPHIPDMLATLAGGQIFGEFDLSEAYFQFQLELESQPYTAFTWKKQQYVCVGCPYGIKHIPSLFQRFIAQLFRDMPYVLTYIDNICFSSKTWEEHKEQAAAIVARLNSVNLRIKPSSVNLGNSQIKLLGHLITPTGIGLDPEKRDLMLQWPRPSNGAELASFLGLGTFLRDHIRYYADLTAPFEKMKRVAHIEWTEQLQQQFELVKRAFATAPFLSFPDFSKRFVIATDASQTGVGGVLYQPDDEENTITPHNIVAIVSKQLNETQRRYPVYKKELWAVVYCLRKFHTFVHGRVGVTVITDHKPLIHILKQQSLSTALQQWLDVLLDYDLRILYRPGVLHVIPDALSRMYMSTYSDSVDTWGTHDNIRILADFSRVSSPSDFLCQQSIDESRAPRPARRRHQLPTGGSGGGKDSHHVDRSSSSSDSSAACLSSLLADPQPGSSLDVDADTAAELAVAPTYAPLFSLADTDSLPSLLAVRTATMTDEERLLVAQEKRGRKVPTAEMQASLVEQAHAAGHFGEKAMYAYIDRRGYWWPHVRDDIAAAVRDCRECQRHNVVRTGFHPAQSVFAARPCDHWMVDLAQLPRSLEGHTFCLVLVDVFTGFIMLRPLADKQAATVARALWEICCILGVPKVIQSDNGSEFANAVVNCLCRLTGIHRRFIAPYNPRADGKVERAVKTVKQMVIKLMKGASALWPLYIPFVQLAYNSKVQELTGSTPFSLMFGRPLNELRDYTAGHASADAHAHSSSGKEEDDGEEEDEKKTDCKHCFTSLDEWKAHQEKVVSLIMPSIEKRITGKQAEMRKRLDATRKRVTADELTPGTLVMIKDPAYLLKPNLRPAQEPEWIGPYSVIRRTLYGPYLLRSDTGDVYDRRVPFDQMKVLYTPTSIPEDRQEEEKDTYEVEHVMAHEEKDGVYRYKVKWRGYADPTWVGEDAFNDPQPVERYFKLLAAKEQAKRARAPGRAAALSSADILTFTSPPARRC